MSDISLSKAVRSNLLSLQNTANLMAKTQERLATGNKVNSALDNPTNFFTAAALNSRAGDLNALMDSMANGVQTLQAADNGLKSITKTLESMQSTLRQARQDKSFQTASFAALTGTPTGTEELSFSGGAIGATPLTLALTAGGDSPATNAVATAATALGTIDTTTGPGSKAELPVGLFSGPLDVDTANAGAALTFDIGIDGGAATSISIDETTVAAYNLANSTALDPGALSIDDVADLMNYVFTDQGVDATVAVNGGGDTLVFTSTGAENGPSSNIAFGNIGGSGSDAGLTTISTSGLPAPPTPLTFDINGETVTLDGAGGTPAGVWSPAQIVAAINSQVGASAGVSASLDGGRLVLTSTGTAGASDTITVDGFSAGDATALGFAAGPSASAAGADAVTGGTPVAKTTDQLVAEINAKDSPFRGLIRASNDNGRLRIENLSTQTLDIDGVSASGVIDGASQGAADILGNSVRAGLADQFNELRDQLDKLSDDASFNGINLLRGDLLKITFNETGTSSIDIQTKDEQALNASRLSLFNISAEELDSDADIDAFLATLKEALSHVRSQASSFGQNLSIVQNRQDFTKNMINTLQTGAANLTLADMNEEAANLLALQTRQSLSSSALSMASEADQSVLQLLR